MWLYSMVLLVLLSQVIAHLLPQLHYNTSTALIWKCSHSAVIMLEDNHFTILYHDKDYKYIITSKEEQITNCTLHTNMKHHLVNEITLTVYNNHLMKRDTSHPDWFKSYHNLSTTYHWYEELAAAHSSRVTITSIGSTVYGRNIMAVHIAKESANDKPVIYIQCLLHSREWITGPVCMSLAHLLASADTTNDIVFNLLDSVQFIIVPVANPDGYHLTWLNYPRYRFWRKNLATNRESSCLGVDLNRNFNIKWGKYGSSSDPCSDTYKGSSVESELEVQAITSYLLNYPQPILGVIDLHSFSQAIIYPHAWTTSPPPNVRLLKYIAQWTARTANHLGKVYHVEQMSSLYLASGTFTDWLLSDQFVNKNKDSNGLNYYPFSLTVELPPTGDHSVNGFMVPPQQIPSICNGMTPAIIKFALIVANNRNTARYTTR